MLGVIASHYVGGAALGTYADEVLADAPWGWWRSNESASPLADSSGNARSMTVTGAPTYDQTGPKGEAILWPADTGVYAKTADGFVGGTTITLEGWVYLTATPSGIVDVLSIATNATGAADNNAALYVDATGKPAFYYYNGGNRIVTGPDVLALNTWHHLVGVGSSAGQRLRVNKATVATSTNAPVSYTQAVWIHAGWNNTAQAIQIAEPAIYATALTDARIDAHYDAA